MRFCTGVINCYDLDLNDYFVYCFVWSIVVEKVFHRFSFRLFAFESLLLIALLFALVEVQI